MFSTWYGGRGLEKQENVANYRATVHSKNDLVK